MILCLAVAGCSKQPAPAAQSSAAAPAVPASSAAPAGTSGAEVVTGAVQETMDAASYTYVRVGSDKGDVWAAAPQFPVKVGERVTVPLEMPMKNFHSQSLNRDFPVIYFVSRISREGEAAATPGAASPPTAGSASTPTAGSASTPTMMTSHGAGVTPPPAQVTEPMPAPPGGMTIANLWANRKSLGGKTVTLRGKVVKFNGGILGHNWLHIQDGTGKAADNTNDITVTTSEDVVANVGDTVTVTGTVVLDKDIGSGYAYAAVIENARVVGSKKS